MRQPLWMVNVILISIFVIIEGIFFIMQSAIPRKFSLEPGALALTEKKPIVEVVAKKIYEENDLFGTYVSTVPSLLPTSDKSQIPPIPQAPAAIPLVVPVEKPAIFIAPLAVTLKGVIYLQDDTEHSVAILQFKDSKKEHNYRVGQMIQDAQILKIFPNRVIVVRSNGQQETLYLRETDLKKAFEQSDKKGFENIIVSIKNNKRYLPLEALLKQVRSLGQFIEMLGLLMVHKKGVIVGCRVGSVETGSLGDKLGFESGDLLKKVDDLVINNLKSRIAIYDYISTKKVGDEISVQLERDEHLHTITYVLGGGPELSDTGMAQLGKLQTKGIQTATVAQTEADKKKILEQKVRLAPTMQQIKLDEQRKFMEARKKNMLSNSYIPKQ